MDPRRIAWALGAASAALLIAAFPLSTEARPRKKDADKKAEARGDKKADKKDDGKGDDGKGDDKKTKKHGKCSPQRPQYMLTRSTYVVNNKVLAPLHNRSIRYRIEQYGRVEGFGSSDWNPHLASHYAQNTTFFGLPIRLNEKVVPALKCVEEELHRSCGKHSYKPQAIGGYRDHNSYRGGEITNHLFGIAIDIDPEQNPCCRCVEPWPDHPACKGDKKTIYDRMAMPKCWVDTFEKYGFYWLGHDRLQDTMHFEFLGRPDRIFK